LSAYEHCFTINEINDCLVKHPSAHSVYIMGNDLCHLPSGIRYMTNMTLLNMCHNNFEMLPSWIGDLQQLQTISISYNKLKRLPITLGHLTRLECLELSRNPLYKHKFVDSISSVQTFLRPFRCALKCQSVVVAILGTYRQWQRFRLPRDMASMLANEIWKMRENPTWSE